MKNNKKFLVLFLIALMFCAVVSGGCGGGHDGPITSNNGGTENNDNDGNSRQTNDFEDVEFMSLSGQWEVLDGKYTYIYQSENTDIHDIVVVKNSIQPGHMFRIKANGDGTLFVANYFADSNKGPFLFNPVTAQFSYQYNDARPQTMNERYVLLAPSVYTLKQSGNSKWYESEPVVEDEADYSCKIYTNYYGKSYNPDYIVVYNEYEASYMQGDNLFQKCTVVCTLKNITHDY